MRTRLIQPVLALAALAIAGPASAQSGAAEATLTQAEAEVLGVVQRLFDGMRAADTTAMRSTFHPDIRLITTGERDGRPVAAVVPVDGWLEGVAGSGQTLDEQIIDPEVRVADGLATVWTFYTLHVGDRFSHCGYDAFQLVRTAEGWKITQVADTRQQRCPEEGGA